MDNEEVLDTQEVNLRLDKSSSTIMNRKRVKKIEKLSSRDKLRVAFLKNFQHQNKKIILKDLPLLDTKVDLGEDADLVLTEYFSKVQNIENK
jgi:hypothetical protein